MPNRTGRRTVSGGISGKLSDRACNAFVRRAERGKKLADGGGLHLFITPAGGATWRVKYRIDGKEKIYSVGPYPLVSLAAARVELGEVKALLLENKDPVTERRISRAATAAGSDNTFKVVEDIHKRDVLETATRILQHLNGVFRYAQAKGLCRDNPAVPAREVLPRKKDNGRMPAVLD